MFLIGIFGVDTNDREVRELPSILCPNCHGTHPMMLYKHYQVFHFFFIPLIKWNITYYVACPHCQNISLVNKEKGLAVEGDETYSLSYWDLNLLPSDEAPTLPHFKKCLACNQWIDEAYAFCPHCGQKQPEDAHQS